MNPAGNLKEPSTRLVSIDALRGFDMLLIAGGSAFIEALKGQTSWQWIDVIASQLTHPKWFGFTFYDFIFPLFLFIAGISIPFSVYKSIAAGADKQVILKKAFRRMIILILLGIVDKNTPITFFEPHNIRVASVLGRIGIAGFFATLLYINTSSALKRIYWIAGILLFYYAIVYLPGLGGGDLSKEGNIVGRFDRSFLPGRLLEKIYDENGLLTQLPAMCLTMLGTLAGDILRSGKTTGWQLKNLALSGVACIALAFIWNMHFPIFKKMWTSSFILLTGGMGFLIFTVFYLVIDVWHFKKWAFFFYVIGLNSLTIYLLYRFVDFEKSARLLFSGLYAPVDPKFHPALQALGGLLLVWLILYFLYRKKIFIKI
ncbi:MAG: DUF5009 domain-containing protein [Terrimonas sp.]|nr:DUF5009 domain-containing protein [Terrimonas sp.]OJY93336.1 MAG: DUF5009 domain-containing protein [Sphingobacteriales bacterium 40-81]